MEEKTAGDSVIQEISTPAFDIYHKIFGSGNGEERITITVYEIRTSPKHDGTLKIILCKASYPDDHPIVHFIPYGIQGITNKDTYKKHNQKPK